jgi:ferredoxin--NADP+ reductase
MLASRAFSRASTTTFNSRVFVFEVAGLFNQQQSLNQIYPIRQHGNLFYQVPFGQMNQVMQRLTRLGAKIVSIQPLEKFSSQNTTPSNSDEGE